MKTFASFVRTLLASAALAAAGCNPLLGSEVLHWNRVALDTTTRAMPLDPITESRILAIVHLAMHDAANTVKPRFETYAPAEATGENASFDAAVASAARVTLRELVPDHAAAIDAEFRRRSAVEQADAATARGLAVGERAAARLLALRRDDGASRHFSRPGGTRSGDYRPTAPDFAPALHSHWGTVRPFALTSARQFRPLPPPAPGSAQARIELEAVRAIGGAMSTERTFEQSEIASYWYEPSTRAWNRIACQVALARGLDASEQARLLALVNVAMADGFIAGFEAKDHYHYWRPSTAIREQADAQWISYLPTPPVPDYPSTHTVLGAAAATVMARFFGTDYVSFTMTSGAPYPNITRRFWSFSQAAQENGASRVFAGVHFASSVQAGYQQGVEIGAWTSVRLLQPRDVGTAVRITAN